jgi:tetratricopeptide (TPR) repeat protein
MSKHYESEPLPYTLSKQQYRMGGPNNYLQYEDMGIKSMDLGQYIELLAKDHKALRVYRDANVLPTKEIILNVDVDKVRSMGIVPANLDSLIVPQMRLRVKGNALEMKDLALLDLLYTSNWERPLYVNQTSLSQFNIDLRPFIVTEGNAYRILPIYNPVPQERPINTELAMENMLNKFQFRGLDDPDVYFSVDYRNFVQNHRATYNELAETLIQEGKKDKAREVLLFNFEKMPDAGVPYDFTNALAVRLLFEVGEKEKAVETATIMGDRCIEMTEYLIANRKLIDDVYTAVGVLGELQRTLYQYGEPELAKKYEDAYDKNATTLQMFRGGGR